MAFFSRRYINVCIFYWAASTMFLHETTSVALKQEKYQLTLDQGVVGDEQKMAALTSQLSRIPGARMSGYRLWENRVLLDVSVHPEYSGELAKLKGVAAYSQTNELSLESTSDVKDTRRDEYVVVLKTSSVEQLGARQLREKRISTVLEEVYHLETVRRFRIATMDALLVKGPISDMAAMQRALADDVAYIEAVRRVRLTQGNAVCHEQATGPGLWGLSRIAMETLSSYEDTFYPYSEVDSGAGVSVYVVDSGINVDHVDFQDRAVWGYTVPDTGEGDFDGAGHGTHVAGTIGSRTYGVAKEATLVAVKAFTSFGEGWSHWTMEAIEWVVNDFQSKGKERGVINLSIGGLPVVALEDAIRSAVNVGMVVVASAGNDNTSACDYSPARMSEVITVASSGESDVFSYFSNRGHCVDIVAPGEMIFSTFVGSNVSLAIGSGTSMSAPHVSGLAARYLSAQCQPPTPETVRAWIMDQAIPNAIVQVPDGTSNVFPFVSCMNGCVEQSGVARVQASLGVFIFVIVINGVL